MTNPTRTPAATPSTERTVGLPLPTVTGPGAERLTKGLADSIRHRFHVIAEAEEVKEGAREAGKPCWRINVGVPASTKNLQQVLRDIDAYAKQQIGPLREA